MLGEDVGYFGGVFRVTEGLQKKYGSSRVFDTPIAENGIIATAIGMAAYGLRPIAEIQFADYIYPAYDQIVSEAARLRYRTAGEWSVPMVIRSPYGGGIFGGQTHSQSPEALFAHVAGVKTVIPSTPYDAKGLLIAAIEDNDPVLFFEPKRIYNGPFDGFFDRPVTPWARHPASEVPEGYYSIPLGKAAVVREGEDVTILSYGTMVHVTLATVRELGIDAEVIDLRTIVPLDIEAIEQSVQEDRPLRRGPRGDAHQRLRRRARRAGPGALLLSSRGAGAARDGLRHALSALARMGLFPWARADRHGAQESTGGLTRMSRFEFRLPDIGEGIAEAEIVAWHVKVGDEIAEDQQLADMMTDKATVEMESPVAGKVIELAGEVGDQVADRLGAGGDRDRGRGSRGGAGRGQQGRAPARRRRGAGDARRMAEEIPVTKVEESARPLAGGEKPRSGEGVGASEAKASRTPRPAPASGRREQGPRLPRRAPARPRSRHRPCAGEDRERPRPPLRPRRLPALQRRHSLRPRHRRSARRRDDQGGRPAPQDRREHAGGEAPHPAFHLGRGI